MKKLLITLMTALLLVACGQSQDMPITEFSASNLEHGAVLVDVRTPEEFGEGHLEGALNIDWFSPDFDAQWGSVDKDKTVYVYCKVGGRSAKAQEKLKAMGYSHVVNLTGGYDAYLAAGKK